MGTRGLFGFRHKKKLYLVYRQFDSYPDGGLGSQIVQEIKEAIENKAFEQWPTLLERLKVIDRSTSPAPTTADIQALAKYQSTCDGIKEKKDEKKESNKKKTKQPVSWGELLFRRFTTPSQVLQCGYLLNEVAQRDAFTDWCIEYGYVINFDMKQLDFYQDGPDCLEGRKPHASYKFDALPNDW